MNKNANPVSINQLFVSADAEDIDLMVNFLGTHQRNQENIRTQRLQMGESKRQGMLQKKARAAKARRNSRRFWINKINKKALDVVIDALLAIVIVIGFGAIIWALFL